MPAAVLICGVALVLLIGTLVVSDRRAALTDGSFADIESALTSSGLAICRTVDDPDGQANQATHTRQYDVAARCPSGNEARVVVHEFANAADRDATMRNLEVQVRPRGNGVVYTYASFAIYVFGQSADRVQDRIDVALRGIGAR